MHDPLLHLHHSLLVNAATPAAAVLTRPALSPSCRVVHDGGRFLVEHGGTVVTLEGRAAVSLLPRLLPLLDGTRTIDELTHELGPAIAPAIEQALSLLESNRLLVDGTAKAEANETAAGAAAYAVAVAQRGSEAEAARALSEARVAVLGSGATADEVARQLVQTGAGHVECLHVGDEPGREMFVLAAPAADEAQALAHVNEWALRERVAWLQVLPFDGRTLVAGPLYLPGSSACHRCYVLRRGACSGYEEDFELVEREPARAASPAPLTSVGAGLAVLIALRWLTTLDPTLPGRLYAVESGSILRVSHDQVLRVPRCHACGPPRRAVPSPWFEET